MNPYDKLSIREKCVVHYLLMGCGNEEIAKELHIARHSVKAHFNRMFMKFQITGGIKRVKLAVLMYRARLCERKDLNDTAQEHLQKEKEE